ncbi:MAG: hypothetical protein PVH84_05475 [Candidatus Aminicenantes bacterium]|jgi:hypothetical protein
MYIGVDFLIDPELRLYLSEINTGVPGGAQEYDLIHRVKYSTPSGIFDRIDALSRKNFGKNFYDYTNSLPYIDDLRALKIWMDGQGPLPTDPAPELKLEDKWVQYLLLSNRYQMILTRIYARERHKSLAKEFQKNRPIVLKKRLGRGGKGFLIAEDISKLEALDLEDDLYLIQPYVHSQVGDLKLSLRAAAFVGEFLCMFANLSPRLTSNHGYRFSVSPGEGLRLSDQNFRTRRMVQKSWEADVFFNGDIPDYLSENTSVEDIAEAELTIPQPVYETIEQTAASISRLYMDLDFEELPRCYIEDGKHSIKKRQR